MRPAYPHDAALVFALVTDFAAFESLPIDATQEGLAAALFSPHPRVFCEIADWVEPGRKPEAAGFAIWYYTFSTFRGRAGIFLEDLFVRPAYRRRRVGSALLMHLAKRCLTEGLEQLDWIVLGWNQNAIDFYRQRGAQFRDEWRICRVRGEALERLSVKA